MANLEKALDRTLHWEGGHGHHKNDAGGETYKGIARAYNRRWTGWPIIDSYAHLSRRRFALALKNNEELQALVLKRYRERYWAPIRGDDIRHQAKADVLFDTAVLFGPHRAVTWAQYIVGADIDGKMGPQTLGLIAKIKPEPFCSRLAWRRAEHHAERVKKDRDQGDFIHGWIRRCRAFANAI